MFNRILVPLDGSQFAELAIPYAEEVAEAFNSKVTVLFVCDEPHCEQRHEHQVYVEKTAQTLKQHIGEKKPKTAVKPVVLEGHAATEIINYTVNNDISLIIMGTHGCTGLLCWAMGSTADKVVDRATTPILLIRASEPAPEIIRGERYKRILLPLDGSEAGEAALPYIKALADRMESEVILFQVVPPGRHVHTIGGLDYVRFDGHLLDLAKTRATEYLDQAAAKLKGARAKVKSEVRTGDTARSIIDFANEIGASLVAMSTHGHTSIERWALGSVTHRVLHHGNTPILLVRAQGLKRDSNSAG